MHVHAKDTQETSQNMSIPSKIDPRGQRFAAALTSVVLAIVLLTAPSPVAVALLAVQAVLFALGAFAGPQSSPYGLLFKTVVRPRIGAPKELEDSAPPRFAQAVGLAFAVVALAGYLSGATLLGAIATGFALGAAFLNAAFGFCLGCEIYLLVRRIAPGNTITKKTNRAGFPVA
jgi:hypothetical protein